MIYPIVMPVHTGGGSIRPFESTLEMIGCGSIWLAFNLAVLGFCCVFTTEIDSILGRVFLWTIATIFTIGWWCIFAMFC